jgi:hypothetical protein
MHAGHLLFQTQDGGASMNFDEMYVYLSVADNGQEGVLGGIKADNQAFTLCFHTEEEARKFLPGMSQMAQERGITVRLCRYSQRQILEEVEPSPQAKGENPP